MARPREFDHEAALDKIMALFWKKGFHETSLDDVIDVSGLKKGSLYLCFGNKEELFRLALERYAVKGPFAMLMHIENPLERLAAFYSDIIKAATTKQTRHRGCFVFNSSLEFAGKAGDLEKFVSEIGNKNESFFIDLMTEAKRKKQLAKGVSIEQAASRAHATAFTIQEMSKFRTERLFLADVGNAFFESIGSEQRLLNFN